MTVSVKTAREMGYAATRRDRVAVKLANIILLALGTKQFCDLLREIMFRGLADKAKEEGR